MSVPVFWCKCKMPIVHVSFTSRKRAELVAGDPRMAVISITDPGAPPANLSGDFFDVLRLSFFDAVPADEFLPSPHPGMFDHRMAQHVIDFVHVLHAQETPLSVMVHCECGVSRSAAVALFVEAYSGAPLDAREYTYDANTWVIDRLQQFFPDMDIEIPPRTAAVERRFSPRPN